MEHNDRIRGTNGIISDRIGPAESLNTRELAACFRVEPATIRRACCVDGHYLTLKPHKLPNGRLLWPKAAVQKVLGGCNGNG